MGRKETNRKEPYKRDKKNTVTWLEEDFSKVPKRSPQNRRQSHLSTQKSEATKKNRWVEKDLRKMSP